MTEGNPTPDELLEIARVVLDRIGVPRTTSDIDLVLSVYAQELRRRGYDENATKLEKLI